MILAVKFADGIGLTVKTTCPVAAGVVHPSVSVTVYVVVVEGLNTTDVPVQTTLPLGSVKVYVKLLSPPLPVALTVAL